MVSKVVTVTLFRRPAYSQQVLHALLQCAGIEEYLVFLHVDPGCQAVIDLARGFRHRRKCVTVNQSVLGCTRNVFESLEHGFQHADFVIHFEDDIVPARDCLRYFEWAGQRFQDDQEIFSVSAYRKSTIEARSYYSARRVAWFNCWGWGTWQDRWTEMRARWGFGEYDSWDICVNRIRGDRLQIEPDLARTQNIGAENGTYCPGPEWHRENQFNEFGAWSVPIDLNAEFTLSAEVYRPPPPA